MHARPRSAPPLHGSPPWARLPPRRLLSLMAALCCAVVGLSASGCVSRHALRHPFRGSGGYTEGQPVVVQGIVSDKSGRPIRDVHVELEASHLGFRVYPWGEQKRDVVTGTTTTDARGGYALQFPWSPRYNHFELVVAIPVATPQGEDRQELARMDVSRRVQQGSPVAVPVTLADTTFLDTMREFLASLRTDEEQKTYHDAGKPDRVDRTSFPDHVDTAWWYFEQGKVYRFRDGHLEKIDTFAPVRPVG